MQGESLKTRLNNLKKASIQLKSKVLNEPRINYESINDIIANILPPKEESVLTSGITHPEMNMTTSKVLNSSGLAKQSNNHSPSSSIFLIPPSNSSSPQNVPLTSKSMMADKFSIPERSSSESSLVSYSKDTIERQIERYRLQNEQIENQLIEVSEELRQLRKKELILEEESWKDHLPFMEADEKVGIFITRLFIKQFDYDKIDFESGRIILSYDKMIVDISQKPQREFKLVDVAEVKYIGDKTIKIDFKSQETIFTFLEFQNSKQRQTFDLAFYVNHNISNSKELDRSLFTEVRQKQESTTPLFTKAAKASRASLRPPEELEDVSSSKNDRLRKNSSKAHDIKMSRSNVSNKSHSHGSSLKKQDSFRNLNGIEYTLNGNQFEQNDYQISKGEQDQNQVGAFNQIMIFGLNGDSNQGSRANTSKFNQAQINFQHMEFQKEQQIPSPPLISPEKIEEQRQMMRWETIIKQLKGGYYFTKYSKDGVNPHNKKVFVSHDENHLISMSTVENKDRKVIPIYQIRSLKYPAIDDGIKKFLTHVVSENFCVIEYELQGKTKKMELGCHNTKFMSQFVEQFKQFLEKKGVPVQ